MKVLLVIVGVLFVGLQIDARAISPIADQIKSDEQACIAELFPLNKDVLKSVDTTNVLPENDENYIKFMNCTGKKLGVISQTGEIMYDKLLENMYTYAKENSTFTSDKLKEIRRMLVSVIGKCHQPSGGNSGLALIKTMNCIIIIRSVEIQNKE